MIRFTKSTSGRTYRLTHTGRPTGNWAKVPGRITSVTTRYVTAPQFDDQVLGDLIRKFWAQHPDVALPPIGILGKARLDRGLDLIEEERDRAAERVMRENRPIGYAHATNLITLAK